MTEIGLLGLEDPVDLVCYDLEVDRADETLQRNKFGSMPAADNKRWCGADTEAIRQLKVRINGLAILPLGDTILNSATQFLGRNRGNCGSHINFGPKTARPGAAK